MRPIVTSTASQKDIQAYHQARKEWEPEIGRPNEFLPSSGMVSPSRTKVEKKKWKPTPTEENKRPDDWLGGSSPNRKKRSWKVKEIKPIILDDIDM